MYTTTIASVSVAATTSTAVSYICLMAKVGMVHSSDVNIEFFKMRISNVRIRLSGYRISSELHDEW